jgi:hypothetical protein
MSTARNTPELADTTVLFIVESKGFQDLREFSAYDWTTGFEVSGAAHRELS